MFLIDDLSIIITFQRLFAVLLLNLLFYLFDQPVFDGTVAVDVIGSDTSLSAVQVFPKTILLAASFKLAVFSTMQGLFPPSSRVTGVRYSAACFMTSLPTDWLPVKKM